MPDPFRHTVPITVRYAETDQMGVVHHANYLVWFEAARTDLCRESGYHYAEIENLGYYLTVVGVDVRYLKSAHYGEEIGVTAWIEKLASRMLTFGYEARCGDALVARGTTDHVWVRREDGRPTRMPGELAPAFERLARGRGRTEPR